MKSFMFINIFLFYISLCRSKFPSIISFCPRDFLLTFLMVLVCWSQLFFFFKVSFAGYRSLGLGFFFFLLLVFKDVTPLHSGMCSFWQEVCCFSFKYFWLSSSRKQLSSLEIVWTFWGLFLNSVRWIQNSFWFKANLATLLR